MPQVLFFYVAALLLVACSGASETGDTGDTAPGTASAAGTESDSETASFDDAFAAAPPWFPCPTAVLPDDAVVVTAFDQEDQYFGTDDRRTVETKVAFPETGSFARVGMFLELACPASGICDFWDRAGSIALAKAPEAPPSAQLELARFVTPYSLEMCTYIDVTPLAARLRGTQTVTSFIDTWVGPGHEQGEGWRTSVRFVFFPSAAAAVAPQVIDVFGMRSITVGRSGDEVSTDPSVDVQTPPSEVAIPASAKRVLAQLIATGHSFGNDLNCAEFCPMRQDLSVNGVLHSIENWREDCPENPVNTQSGTWEYPRNGWCPGAVVVGQTIDVTAAITAGATSSFDFDVRLDDGSVYDNRNPVELPPYELVSLKLFVYE